MKCFLLLVLLYSFQVCAQEKNISGLNKLNHLELDSMLNIYDAKKNYKALNLIINQGLEKAKIEVGIKDTIYAKYLAWRAVLYEYLGEYDAAEQDYWEVKDIYDFNSDTLHLKYIVLLNNIAHLYNKKGKYKQAEAIFLKVIHRSPKTHLENARFLCNLANTKTYLGKYKEAEKIYLQVKKKLETKSKKQGKEYGRVLNDLSVLYQFIGKYEEAASLCLQSLEIKRKNKEENTKDYASSLNNLAHLYYKYMQKYDDAKLLLLEASELARKKVGNAHPDYAIYLGNLASLYSNIEKYEEAEELLLEAKEIYKKALGKESPGYGRSLNSLADLYLQMGKYGKSKLFYWEALEIAQKVHGKHHPIYSIALHNLSSFYYAANELDMAFSLSVSSIATNSKNFDTILPGFFINRGTSTIDKYSYKLCCEEFKPSAFLKLSQLNYSDLYLIPKSLRLLLAIILKQYQALKKRQNPQMENKLQEYYNICKAAIQIHENMCNAFSSKENKLRILQQNGTFVKSGIWAALKLGKPINIVEAFGFAEQNKSILLANALKGNRIKTLGELPDSLRLQELELQYQYDVLKKKKYIALNKEDSAKIVMEENELNDAIHMFKRMIKEEYPKYHALKYDNIRVNAKNIQNIINDNTILLEYFVSNSIVYLFCLTKNDVKIYTLNINKRELDNKVKILKKVLSNYKYFRNAFKTTKKEFKETAYWFYKKFLEIALDGENGIEHIIVVPDYKLNYLPFEVFLVDTLQDDYKSFHYLLKDYTISYSYSAKLLKENKNKPSDTSFPSKQILACASSYPNQDSSLLEIRRPHIFNKRSTLNGRELPYSLNEIKNLKDYKGDYFIGEETNEQFFKKNAKDYRVIHLAMHGLWDKKMPILSSLAFTEDKNSLEDNFLQAYEISKLKLNADLVVLSACETGYGLFQQGEGVLSLARAFMYAGVPSLVVSLWQVNDESTAELMHYFYKNLARGLSKDKALCEAKRKYIENTIGKRTHPFFWSSFIQLGDTNAIDLQEKSYWSWWASIIGVFTIIGVFICSVLKKNRKSFKS